MQRNLLAMHFSVLWDTFSKLNKTQRQRLVDTNSLSKLNKIQRQRLVDTISFSKLNKIQRQRLVDTISLSKLNKIQRQRLVDTNSLSKLNKINDRDSLIPIAFPLQEQFILSEYYLNIRSKTLHLLTILRVHYKTSK